MLLNFGRDFILPGFVPMMDRSSCHLGLLGSIVWKKAQKQMDTRAARHP